MRYPAEHGKTRRRGEGSGFSARQPRAGRVRAAAAGRREAPSPGRSLVFSLTVAAAAALCGAALPFLAFGEFSPRTFTATAVVGLEKGEAAATLAQRLKSADTLDRIASSLSLHREPALAGLAPGPLAVAGDLLSGTERTAAPPSTALQRTLSESLSLMPDRQAGILSLAATTPDAALSVRIANAAAREGVDRAESEALDRTFGLTAAREAAERAERALADVSARAGSDLDAAARLSAEIAEFDATVAAREAALATARSESARIGALKIADIAGGPSDLNLDAPLFEEARRKYVSAKLELDRLAAELGPRHPRLLAARSSADDARTRLQDSLLKLDAAHRDKVRAAARALEEAKAARARLDATSAAGGDAQGLEAMRAEADRLRADYLDKLDLSRAAPSPAGARIVVPASEATVIENGASPLFMSVAGAGIGLLLAFAWLYLAAGRGRADEAAMIEVEEDEEDAFAGQWRHDDDAQDEDFEEIRYRDDAGFRDDADEWAQEEDDWGPPPAHNDDMPLAEQLRTVLRRSAQLDALEEMQAAGLDRRAEIEDLRRRMAVLKYRVEAYRARQVAARR